ncbi:MAG: peptide chain release factor 1 [Lachnospiraceae bacterium]|nr:peptide chain release factor 1 [Lachnospiraceae bacterium]
MFDNLENVRMHYDELMHQISEPEIASDGARFQRLMKEINSIKPLVDTYTEYKKAEADKDDAISVLEEEKDEELRELAKEEQSDAEERISDLSEKLKILLLPKDPNDDKDVIMEIRAGAGGDEAALFASDLYRMYTHFAESRGWHTEIIECEETGIGGMKQVNFSVSGQGAYSILKYESGVHRVQRVPVTESGGRIHTSTATVAVMPEAEDVDIEINEKDIRIDVMRASGNGGQCVNTTDSAVRLTHYPTGIVIYSQTEKSQLQNKNKAFALLRAKLYDLKLQEQQAKEKDERLSQIGTGDRSEKIRTYNFPQGRVTDHRIGLTIYRLDDVMNGDLTEILDALIAADQSKKLAKLNEAG